MHLTEITKLLSCHLSVWSEPDETKRLSAIAEIYAEDVHVLDPFFEFSGRAQLNGFVEELQKIHPGYQFRITHPVESHHNIAHFGWSFGPTNDPDQIKGHDVVVLAQGRIQKLYVFIDGVSKC